MRVTWDTRESNTYEINQRSVLSFAPGVNATTGPLAAEALATLGARVVGALHPSTDDSVSPEAMALFSEVVKRFAHASLQRCGFKCVRLGYGGWSFFCMS